MDGFEISGRQQLNNSGLERLRSLDLSTEEEQEIAFEFWSDEIHERTVDDKFESAWHCLRAAAEGDDVFTGPDRLCRGHLEGLPVGLICSTTGIMELVQQLYREMREAGVLKPIDLHQLPPSWKFDTDKGVIELLTHGDHVARIMHRQHSPCACVAALQVYAIADWASNHRRLELAN